MVSLEDTELSCVAGLPRGEGGEISALPSSFGLLLHKYNGLLKVPVLSVNSRPSSQLHPAASVVPSSGVRRFFGDPDKHVETLLSEAWQPPFSSGWCLCLFATLQACLGLCQLSFLFWNDKVKQLYQKEILQEDYTHSSSWALWEMKETLSWSL